MASVFSSGNAAAITVDASGIGLAIAKRSVSHGIKVIIVDRDAELLISVAKEIGNVLSTLKSTWASSKTGKSQGQSQHHLWRFINHWLLIYGDSWHEPEAFRTTFDTNLYGVINGLNSLIPLVGDRQQSSSAIVITGSKQGITNPPENPAYNASKAAVKSVAEHLSFDLSKTATKVHLLVPGWTFTSMVGAGTGREKPGGAWTPEQIAENLEQKMMVGLFYIICPDNEVTEDLDRKRRLWSVGDIIEGRPPLSRWHEDYRDKAQACTGEQQ
ncbi:putative oxidoreductase [Colletotrichum chlorophyti]|uniref:Putative oxidoreductase n=1 Tax=Colletotrichum chlorophyti TaxID=708187 RepID=A0A1Q8S1I9_9PEZI|nr:putative oxidoreductase [Colletotrichum chlorophyti]